MSSRNAKCQAIACVIECLKRRAVFRAPTLDTLSGRSLGTVAATQLYSNLLDHSSAARNRAHSVFTKFCTGQFQARRNRLASFIANDGQYSVDLGQWSFRGIIRSCALLPAHFRTGCCGVHLPDKFEAWRRGAGESLTVRRYHASGMHQRGDRNRPPRLLIVQPRIHPRTLLKAKLLEAMRLADSLEGLRGESKKFAVTKQRSPFVLVQSPQSRSSHRQLRAGGYFGAGTIDIVRAHVDAAASQDQLDAIFVNTTLSGVQQRNLETAWGRPVLDRVGLIIEIFGAHAETKEAKLQVELASLDYQKTRLVRALGKDGERLGFGEGGAAEVVSARGRASGAIGGAGETELQLQRRRIGQRRTRLKTLLADVRRTRSLHRAGRQRHALAGSRGLGLPLVAVVGYTNAGKSSLVAALSKSSVYVDDRLFATLDSRVRSVVLPSGQKVLLSDTVGFISDLPVQLVEAFQATLQEVVEADFLLHVIDSSAINADEQRQAVLEVLREIGVPQFKLDNCMMEAWNKVDLLESASGFESNSNPLLVEWPLPSSTGEEVQKAGVSKTVMDEDMMQNASDEVTTTQNLEQKQENVVMGLGWSYDGVTRVSTSAATGIGLGALLDILDKRLAAAVDVNLEDSLIERGEHNDNIVTAV